MVSHGAVLLACALTGLLRPQHVASQVLASQHAAVSQTVDGTTITISYYRPTAQGRDVFGEVVKWEDLWTPGANWATTLEVDTDVYINNEPVPKGRYSVWVQPRQGKVWQLMLSRRARVYHLWPPPLEEEQLRLLITPHQDVHTEILTWSIPVVTRDAAMVTLRWGTVVLPFHIAVPPSRHQHLTAEGRTPFVGSWALQVMENRASSGSA